MPENHFEDHLENSVLKFSIGGSEIKVLSFKKEDKKNDFFGRIHAKNFYELRYVACGKGVLLTKDQKHSLKKGNIYLIDPEQLYHTYSDDNKFIEYSIIFQLADADNELARIFALRTVILHDTPYECEVHIKSAENELTEHGRFYADKVISSIRSLLIYLVREIDKNAVSVSLPEAAKDDRYCIMVDAEFSSGLQTMTLKRLSSLLGLSERQCQRFLMNNYGMSYSEKLLQARMIKAADYLAFTDIDIQTIVEKVGYSENSYFSRIFKKYYGITPGDYRKKNRRY